jgi:hypothetical protein
LNDFEKKEMMKSKCPRQRITFEELEIGVKKFEELINETDDSILKKKEEGSEEIFCVNEKEKIESKVNCFREVLRLSGGSLSENKSRFWGLKSNNCIEIDRSLELIRWNDFIDCGSLTKVIFFKRESVKRDSWISKLHITLSN